jgi:pimeloyl-ACP methyl ester carboxylesterase
VLAFILTGCGGSAPSLTGEEIQARNPNHTYVEIDGVALHYQQTGLGRPLIFIHGLLEDYRIWRHITPGLTYGNTVYELDLMGFGLSEKPQDKTYDLDTYLAQLTAYIENFHLENIILAGHDFGAVIATAYAIQTPANVHKLILMSAPISAHESLPLNIRLLGVPLIGSLLSGDWFLKRILQEGVFDKQAMSDAMVKQYLEPFEDDPGARAALHKFLREFDLDRVVEEDIFPNLSALTMPTLLLYGGQDQFTSMDVARELDVAIPSADLQVVTRSGHFILEDRPEDVRQQIKEWIDKR